LAEVFSAFPGVVKIFHNDTDNPVSYPFLTELGIHIFNFTHLQPIEKVRERVGPEVCLMGNVSPLEILVKGTADQVREETRRCLDAYPGRAGLLLSAGGGVSPGTPGPNLTALIEAVGAYNVGADR
jgi:uroporphyrinogen decarboxylase